MVLGGFLVSVKSLPFWSTFSVFVLGYTANGYGWYAVGYFAGSKPLDRWIRKDPKGEKVISTIQKYFEMHSGKTIFITKFTFSLTIAAMIMAGSLKYNLKKFTWYNFLGSIGWVGMTMSIGYFFGQSYQFFVVYLKNVSYFIIFLGSSIALIYILKIMFRSAFIKSVFEHDLVRHYKERLRGGFNGLLNNGNDRTNRQKGDVDKL